MRKRNPRFGYKGLINHRESHTAKEVRRSVFPSLQRVYEIEILKNNFDSFAENTLVVRTKITYFNVIIFVFI